MKRRTAQHICALLAASVLSSACFEMTGIDEDETHEIARLMVSFAQPDRDTPVDFSAVFHPGTLKGVIRPVEDEAIRLNDMAFGPTQVHADGMRIYDVSGLSASPSFFVRPPVVAGPLPQPVPTFTVEMIRIVAPDTLVADRDGVLEVVVDGVANAENGSWTVLILTDDATLSLQSNTPPRGTIVVPVAMLQAEVTAGRLDIRVRSAQFVRGPQNSWEIGVSREARAVVPFRINDS